MLNNQFLQKALEYLDLNSSKVEQPRRFVDFDVTTSFAHCTPNLTSDEVFGYAFLERLIQLSNGELNVLACDYDGTVPEKEKPSALTLETLLRYTVGYEKRSAEAYLPFYFNRETPLCMQPFNQKDILRNLDQPWNQFIKSSGFRKEDRPYVNERFGQIISAVRNCVKDSQSTLEFLERLRKEFLAMAGICISGKPESENGRLFAQKLEEDLEAGFPFWRMDLPDNFAAKHKSNNRTYLFWGVSQTGKLLPVKFEPNPDRFEFNKYGENIVIPAEESPQAMAERVLLPTVSLLNYIVLSPARKEISSSRTRRIHLAGQFMAGKEGYARDLVPYFNKTPGFDSVSLVCTEYDGSLVVKDKQNKYIGFGSVFPQFGREGIKLSLEGVVPQFLRRGVVYHG